MTLVPYFRVIQGSCWEVAPFASQSPGAVGPGWYYMVIMGETGVMLCSVYSRAS